MKIEGGRDRVKPAVSQLWNSSFLCCCCLSFRQTKHGQIFHSFSLLTLSQLFVCFALCFVCVFIVIGLFIFCTWQFCLEICVEHFTCMQNDKHTHSNNTRLTFSSENCKLHRKLYREEKTTKYNE